MAKGKDILLDNNNDMLIESGDFVIGESDNQNIDVLLTENRGSFKQNPIIGLGIIRLIKTNYKKREIKRAINVELNRDGYNNIDISLDFKDNKLNVKIDD